MNYSGIPPQYKIPVLSYLFIILLIFALRLFFDTGLVFSISATLMLLIPLLLKNITEILGFNAKGFIRGVVITLIILLLYVLALFIYANITGRQLTIREVGISFFIVQFLLVALPEEVFFRAYLQKEFGNGYKAIIVVSLLFAIAHLLIVCIADGGISTCTQNALTFFPSLVMGYLFMKTKTVWSSILFHYLANICHILIRIS